MMESLFLWSAIIGATVFLGQFAMSLLSGVEGDVDAPHGDIDFGGHDIDVSAHDFDGHVSHGDTWFVGMLSLRAIAAGATVFGLVGLGVGDSREPFEQMLAATAGGFGTMYLMGWLIRSMHKLESDGTVRMEDTVGSTGTVYLPVPESKSGTGKVTVIVNERTMEYPAVTSADELPAGTPVVVTGIISDGVVEVAPVTEQAAS